MFLQVIWGRLYSNKSTKEKGTMYQLRNVINRTMVPPDPEKNMNAAEDFMLLLVHTRYTSCSSPPVEEPNIIRDQTF